MTLRFFMPSFWGWQVLRWPLQPLSNFHVHLTWWLMHHGVYGTVFQAKKEETPSGEKWCQTKYLFILCWNSLTNTHRLPVLIHFIILFIHPLIENISVQNPFCVNLQPHQSKNIYINYKITWKYWKGLKRKEASEIFKRKEADFLFSNPQLHKTN